MLIGRLRVGFVLESNTSLEGAYDYDVIFFIGARSILLEYYLRINCDIDGYIEKC